MIKFILVDFGNLQIILQGRMLNFIYALFIICAVQARVLLSGVPCNSSDSRNLDNSNLTTESDYNKGVSFICMLSMVFFILICLGIIYALWNKIKQRLREKNSLRGNSNFEIGDIERLNYNLDIKKQADLLPYNTKLEFPIHRLKFGDQVGSGEFGDVFKARAMGIVGKRTKTTVAVQKIKENNNTFSIKALASDLKIMIQIGRHLNLVNLLGACTENINKRELMIIIEYCHFGNIHEYLQKHRDCFIDQVTSDGYIEYNISNAGMNISNTWHEENIDLRPLCTYDLICWSWQVARGMEYLNSRNIIHEDLTLTNILLAKSNIVKICNFGITKTIYSSVYQSTEFNEINSPTKWMAIESLRDRIFSIQSDIWAFGVVLWEMFSLAETPPYPDIPEHLLINKLVENYRMAQPKHANSKIYGLMLDCWEKEPMKRPSFCKLTESLGYFLQERTKSHYIGLNEVCMTMNSEKLSATNYFINNFTAPTFTNRSNASNQNTSVGIVIN